ncbi:MAG: FG-GAP-like repeat-containing protein [Patescibacteria group bacterium]|jgi:hypothetical protein
MYKKILALVITGFILWPVTSQAETSFSTFQEFSGEAANDNAGLSVTAVGDMNGDGYDDFVTAATNNDSGGDNAGAVYLIYGSSAALTSKVLSDSSVVKFSGAAANDYVGTAAGAGDINGDGYDDLLVSNSNSNDYAGVVYLLYGQATKYTAMSLSTASFIKINGETAGEQAGSAIARAGDVNNDGYADFMISAFDKDSNAIDAGAVYLVYGQATRFTDFTLSNVTAVQINGANADDFLATNLSAGDVNGDGYSDILLSTYTHNSNTGAVYLLYGQSSHLTNMNLSSANSVMFTGETAGDFTGMDISSGDINGDGYDDIVTSSVLNSVNGVAAGSVYIIYGQATALTTKSLSDTSVIKYWGEASGDAAGSIDVVGDINNDGYADLVVGASRYDNGSMLDVGAVYVLYGQAAGLTGGNLANSNQKFVGEYAYDGAGDGLSSGGDFNGDGFADVLVTAYTHDTNYVDAGVAYLGYLYIDSDRDGVAGTTGLFSGADCNDEDNTVSANQTYYQDSDADGLGNVSVTLSICSSTVPAGYVTDFTDTNDTVKDITSVIGTTNGDILITYVNGDTATMNVFDDEITDNAIVTPYTSNTQYYLVLSANGKKLALVDVYTKTVLATKVLSENNSYKKNTLLLKVLRKRDLAVIVSKKQSNVLVSLVRINFTKGTLKLKHQITLTNKKIVPASTIIHNKYIYLMKKDTKISKTYFVNKLLQLVKK